MPTPEPHDVTLAASRPGPDETASAAPTHAAGPGGPAAPDFLAAPQRADEIGRLGRYRVLAVLGRGGMGMVLRAEDPVLRRQVALKVMLPKVAAHPNARDRFLREARAQAAVEHDHVVPIFDVVDDATPFLAMPLLRGMTLADALRANPRPPLAAAVRIGREVAEGLAAAHAQGLVHRDVKPGNVWLEAPRLRVKVLDFGLARAAAEAGPPAAEAGPSGDADSPPGVAQAPLTETGAVVGTPLYMSPEQARGGPLDPRTDLFSLGVVLFQMTTGRLPFAGPTTAAVLRAVVSDHPAGLAEVEPPLPPALSALVFRLLAKDPADRPATAAGVADELRAIELGLTAAAGAQVIPLGPVPGGGPNPFADLDATEPDTAAPAARPRRTSRRQLALGVLGLAVVAGLAAGLVRVMAPRPEPAAPGEPTRSAEGEKEKDRGKGKDNRDEPPPAGPPFVPADLAGWAGNKEGWAAASGRLEYRPAKGRVAVLWSERRYTDFDLRFTVRVEGENLGISPAVLFRATPAADGALRAFTGGDLHFNPGRNVGLFARDPGVELRLLQKLTPAERKGPKLAPGADLPVALRCVGPRVTLALNGVEVLNRDFDLPADGVIGWTNGAAWGVTFADIRFTDLSAPPDPERAAAAALNPHLMLYLRLGSGRELSVRPTDPLPAEPFAVAGIGSTGSKGLPPGFVGDTFLPAVARLGSLTKISVDPNLVRWTDGDLARLAGLPAGRTLTAFGNGVPLTPATADALKGFPALETLNALADRADDEALVRLRELPALRTLKLDQLGRAGAVTEKGWAAVGGLRLRQLTLGYTPVGAAAARAVATMPDLDTLNFYYAQIAGGAVAELARAKGLRVLSFTASAVTDADLDALAGLPGLERLSMGGAGVVVTEAAVRRLAERRPGCQISYPGGRIDPRKK